MLADAIKSVWWERISNHAALRTKCNFHQYRKISEDTSTPAQHTLIWTLYGSPLDVPDSGGWPLTPQDEFFRNQPSKKKIRVVVFGTPGESKRYAKIWSHITNGKQVGWYHRVLKKHFHRLVERMTSFEAASKTNGTLYFTSVALIAKEIGHHFSKFSVAFVSDDGTNTYCVSSSFAASRQGGVEDIRDVLFFSVTDVGYPGADGRQHYSMLFEELRDGNGGWYFEDPNKVANASSWTRHWLSKPGILMAWIGHEYDALGAEYPGLKSVPRIIALAVILIVILVGIVELIDWGTDALHHL